MKKDLNEKILGVIELAVRWVLHNFVDCIMVKGTLAKCQALCPSLGIQGWNQTGVLPLLSPQSTREKGK